ncbi:MAG: TetR/AcrR family transcriptional regulator [Nitrosopumilus sp.]
MTETKNLKKDIKEKPPTAIKKKIIKVAAKKFARNGYAKTSINDIIASAKVSKGVLFHHFHSKEELFFVVLSQGMDSAFNEIFELAANPDFNLFEKRENLFEDLKKYYDATVAGPREIERLFLAGRIESENNPKLRSIMNKKDAEMAMIISEMLKAAREKIGILEGYNDAEMLEISKGLMSFLRGSFLERLSGKDPKEIKNVWVRTVYMLYSSKKSK